MPQRKKLPAKVYSSSAMSCQKYMVGVWKPNTIGFFHHYGTHFSVTQNECQTRTIGTAFQKNVTQLSAKYKFS